MAGIQIHTTMDSQTYIQESVNANPGQLFIILGVLMPSAREAVARLPLFPLGT